MVYRVLIYLLLFSALLMTIPQDAESQLPRERAIIERPVDNVFWSGRNIGIATVRNLSAGSLNSSVMHTFGLVDGGIQQFYGLDDGANTRLGLEYGFTDRFSAGIGRMTFNKIVDISAKGNILRQTTSDSMPIELAVKTSVAANTVTALDLDFNERLSYFASVMIARKFTHFSLQLSPMLAHFNTTSAVNPDQLFGIGILGNYEFNDRFALSAEYLPVIGERNINTHNAVAIALNIDTGGHIFQLFFTSSQWHNEAFIMANNRDEFWKGDIRFGFNINRAFGIGR